MNAKKILIIIGIVLVGMYFNWFLSGWIYSMAGGDRDIWTFVVTLVFIYPYVLLYRVINKSNLKKL